MDKYTIGIIGGKGRMGQCFSEFFQRHGHDVIISDIGTEMTNTEVAEKADIVLISVPIIKTLDVIRETAPHVRKESLLMDITSLKTKEVKKMIDNSVCEVIGMHPIFGPTVNTFKKQNIVLCPARGSYWLPRIRSIFESEEAIIKETTPKEHDKLMAVVQGITHFTSIAISNAYSKLDIDIKASMEYASPVYRLTMGVLGRILNQDPELYADIQLLNKELIGSVDILNESVDELAKIVKNKDRDKFIEYFKQTASDLGNFPETAQKDSDRIIDLISNDESPGGL